MVAGGFADLLVDRSLVVLRRSPLAGAARPLGAADTSPISISALMMCGLEPVDFCWSDCTLLGCP